MTPLLSSASHAPVKTSPVVLAKGFTGTGETATDTRVTSKTARTALTALAAIALSALSLPALAQTAVPQTTEAQASMTAYQAGSYCTADLEATTQHPDHQSALRRDIDCMMTELRAYQQPSQASMTRYYAYKAQAWLIYAYSEDSEKSGSGAGNIALNKGVNLLTALRDNRTARLNPTSDIPETSSLMRPDLWATLMTLKDHDGMSIAPREMAFSEVKLIWAGSEGCERGWRHSREHFSAAQHWINQAYVATFNTQTDAEQQSAAQAVNSRQNTYQTLMTEQAQCQAVAMGSETSGSQAGASAALTHNNIVLPQPTVTYRIANS